MEEKHQRATTLRNSDLNYKKRSHHCDQTIKNRELVQATFLQEFIVQNDGSDLYLLISLFNSLYATGKPHLAGWDAYSSLWPRGQTPNCDDNRLITLISFVLMAFLKVHTRIYRKCETQVNEAQFGFVNGLVTRRQ